MEGRRLWSERRNGITRCSIAEAEARPGQLRAPPFRACLLFKPSTYLRPIHSLIRSSTASTLESLRNLHHQYLHLCIDRLLTAIIRAMSQ
jgi:hypothetical protein